MFVVVRQYEGAAALADVMAERAADVQAKLSSVEGFVSYHAARCSLGPGESSGDNDQPAPGGHWRDLYQLLTRTGCSESETHRSNLESADPVEDSFTPTGEEVALRQRRRCS